MTLPKAHTNHVPRPPTRAFANTAEPAKPGSQGVKDRRATRTLHSDPGSCEPPDTIPSAPAHRKPDAHRAAEAMRRGQAGTHTPGLPRHLRRDAYWHEISLRTNRHDSCQRHSKRLAVMKLRISTDTRVIISAYRIEKSSEDHPCILRYTPEGLG